MLTKLEWCLMQLSLRKSIINISIQVHNVNVLKLNTVLLKNLKIELRQAQFTLEPPQAKTKIIAAST